MHVLPALALPFALMCAGTPASQEHAFPAAKEGLSISSVAEEEWTIERLLREYSRVTGQNMMLKSDVRTLAKTTKVGLLRPAEIPVEDIHSVVESILLENQFVLNVVHARAPRVLAANSLQLGAGRWRSSIKVRYVPREQIGHYAPHPAYRVMTVVHLQNTDVRTLSNSLQTIVTETNTLKIIPAGSSNSLILSGFSPQVISLIGMLEEIDGNSPAQSGVPRAEQPARDR